MGFIDALVRARIGLSAIGLNLDLDYWPGGTTRREFFETLRRIDMWSQFGMPLVIFLRAPSRQNDTGQAARVAHRSASEDSQAQLVSRLVSLMRAHPVVQGVIWNTWQDVDGNAFAGSGLVDQEGRTKAALSAFKKQSS